MIPNSFRALVVAQNSQNRFSSSVQTKTVADLPEAPILIKVHYSSLNYKDALSANGNKGVTRHYPHTPGIDAAGEVVASTSDTIHVGDQVIVTSYDLGMNTPGGFGQFIRVPADWVVPLPEELTLEESMVFGTAGFTAGLALFKLKKAGLVPESGEVVVTGASGGVGSLAVALLAGQGYRVVAVSGKADAIDWLSSLGAQRVIDRSELLGSPDKALLHKRWAGAIDTVGGEMLSTVLRSLAPNGLMACCGNVASPELHITVFPFIIRGVSLMGIDSATCPMPLRRKIWQLLANEWKPSNLHAIYSKIDLEQLEQEIALMLKGRSKGRKVISLRPSPIP